MEIVSCTPRLVTGSGQWNSCDALPRCLGVVGSGNPVMNSHTALGQWGVQFLQCNASLPSGSGQGNSCHALPHFSGAVNNETPAP